LAQGPFDPSRSCAKPSERQPGETCSSPAASFEEMAPAVTSRRTRGSCLAAALALAVACKMLEGPLGFLPAARGPGPQARSMPLAAALGQARGARPLVAMAAGPNEGGSRVTDVTPFAGKVEEWFDGEVVSIAPYGAFVKITLDSGEEGTGLVHLSRIADTFVDNINDFVEVGKAVRVKLVGCDTKTNKMSLSMRDGAPRAEREPVDLTPFEGIDAATWIKGTVASIPSFGAFVDVKAPGSDATARGLVHITQVKDGFVESMGDELEVGQEVQVRVVSVDAGMGKMGLSMKSEDAE